MQKEVTTQQLRMVYGLAKKAAIDNEMLHDIAARICRRDSLSELTTMEASRLIDYLKRQAGEPAAEPTGRATAAQQGKIYALAREMGWATDPRRLRKFCEKMAQVSDVRFLSIEQAGRIIEAMKKMQEGGRAERKVAYE